MKKTSDMKKMFYQNDKRREKMEIVERRWIQQFIHMCDEGWKKGWHERNGGNASYRLKQEEIEEIEPFLKEKGKWISLEVPMETLANEYFLITGSGKYFQNIIHNPEENIGIIELDEKGSAYRICWGLAGGGKPTSELPTHLMNHEVKKIESSNQYRVIYHGHPANLIAMTFVLPLEDKIFTRQLWEMMTECPVIFPKGIGVLPWEVPGGYKIGYDTKEKMKQYDAVIWAHHGLFCSGESFDTTFGLFHTIEKAAEIYIKVHSITSHKRQTIEKSDFERLAKAFEIQLPQHFL